VLGLMSVMVALAGEPSVHHQQARLHMRRGWPEAAAEELRQAVASPEGRASYAICLLAQEVAFELLDIDWATEMAEAAAAAAPDPAARAAAQQAAEAYRTQFGTLVVTAPHGGMASRLQLESTSLIINPDWKRFINRAALRLRDRSALPLRQALPAGSYLVNGQEVTVTGGQEVTAALPMKALGPRGLTALQVTRIESAAGVRTLGGSASRDHLPSALYRAGIAQPAGPLLIGVVGRISPTVYLDAHGIRSLGPPAADASLRVATELALDGALSVRPGLRAGWGRLAALPLTCSDAACSVATGEEAADRYESATGLTGAGELTIEYRQAGRTTAMGFGVTFSAEAARGTLPAALSDGTKTTEDPWTAYGAAMLANLSLAL